jgi:hypothetical protein
MIEFGFWHTGIETDRNRTPVSQMSKTGQPSLSPSAPESMTTASRASRGFKDFDVTAFAHNFDGDAWSVPADKKISEGISEPQIFDAKFI